MLKFIKSLSLFAFLSLLPLVAKANELKTQTIELYPGWNLISIQVADPATGKLTIPQFLESVSKSGVFPDTVSISDYSLSDSFIQWTDIVGLEIEGSTLTKTASSGWGSGGAASIQTISGDGGVSFKSLQIDKGRIVGLSSNNVDANRQTIDYGLNITGGSKISIYENGANKANNISTYFSGDTFSVERVGSTVYYKQNDATIYTSSVPSSGPLLVDVALNHKGGILEDVKIFGSDQAYWDAYVQFQPILEIWTFEGRTLDGESDFVTPSQMVKEFTDTITSETRRSDLWRSFHSRRSEWSTELSNNLDALRPNKAYWVRSAIRTTATIVGKKAGGDMFIQDGWNFLGFDLDLDSEPVTLDSVLGKESLDHISQVWTFDPSSGEAIGYAPDSFPPTDTLVGVKAGQGYWVESDTSFLLSSNPQILIPADIDESPLSQEESFGLAGDRYTGGDEVFYQDVGFVKFVLDSDEVTAGDVLIEDEDYEYDLNGNGIIDSALTQDTMYFPAGVDRQYVTFTRGIGPSYTWVARSNVPWIQFDQDTGTVAGAQDTLVVSIDRTGLAAGSYGDNKSAQFELEANGITKTVYVKMDVPTVEGDWFGYAKLDKVNGKNIPLGKVDLFLNSSMEDNTEERFTTVLNSDRSLLFPRDVFMNGVFYTDKNFSVTTNFSMAEGDLNAPGYETFANAPQVPGKVSDFDADGDGVVDNMNPFPYRLNREVTLQGTRYLSKYMKLDGNDDLTLVPDDRLEGTYIETVRGILPGDAPILIEGTFVLDREEDAFEATKKTAAVLSNTLDQSIGGTSTQSLETTLTLDTLVTVDGPIEVFVDLSFPISTAYENLVITLIDPNGVEHELQSGATSLLNNGRFFISDENFSEPVTGDWILRLEWDTAERGTLAAWSIDIKGTTSHNLTGVIYAKDDNTALIENAFVTLTGTNIVQNIRTATDGAFDLLQLNENRYKLSIWSPSHQTTTLEFVLDGDGTVSQVSSPEAHEVTYDKDEAKFSIGLKYLDLDYSGESRDFEIISSDILNEGVGNVFYARLPEALLTGPGLLDTTWSIEWYDTVNDTWVSVGTPAIASVSPTDEIGVLRFVSDYDFTAGVYRVSASITRSGGAGAISSNPDPTNADVFTVSKQRHSGSLGLTHWAFLGSLGARTDIDPNVARPDGGWGVIAATGNTCYQESKPDSAAFDIDRYPIIGVEVDGVTQTELSPNNEDTDDRYPWMGDQYGTSLGYQDNTDPARLRCVVRMGYPVFSTSPAAAGNYLIHPGWIDPQL